MRFVNLTPHRVVIRDYNTHEVLLDLPESEYPARIACRVLPDEPLSTNVGTPIPYERVINHGVVGLPAAEEGTGFIVSAMVAQFCPKRKDLYFPSGIRRNNIGEGIFAYGLKQIVLERCA